MRTASASSDEAERRRLTSSSFARTHSQQLTQPSGLGDFTLRDLTHPTSKRIVQVLSAIVNFYFFQEEQGDRVFRPLEDEFEKLVQEEGVLIEENEQLREKIAAERCVSGPLPSRGTLPIVAHRLVALTDPSLAARHGPGTPRS